MSLFHPYQFKEKIDEVLPGLVLIGVAMAISDAVTEGDFKPLAQVACDCLGWIFD